MVTEALQLIRSSALSGKCKNSNNSLEKCSRYIKLMFCVRVCVCIERRLSLIVRLCFNDPNFPPPEYTLFRKIFEEDPSIFIEWDVENHTQKPKKFSLYPKYCGLISHYKVCENKVCEKQLLGGGASLHKKSVVKNPRGCLQHKCMDTLWSAFHKSSALWRQEVVVPLHPYNALNACHGNTTYDF